MGRPAWRRRTGDGTLLLHHTGCQALETLEAMQAELFQEPHKTTRRGCRPTEQADAHKMHLTHPQRLVDYRAQTTAY